MEKHTPWPWSTKALMENDGWPESDARLIAAAPEMYEALKQLANNNLSEDNCSSVELAGRRVANIARAAIAKIEGK